MTFLAAAFLAGAFLVTFLAAAFLAGAFFVTFLAATFLAGAFLVTFLAAAFLAGAFFFAAVATWSTSLGFRCYAAVARRGEADWCRLRRSATEVVEWTHPPCSSASQLSNVVKVAHDLKPDSPLP